VETTDFEMDGAYGHRRIDFVLGGRRVVRVSDYLFFDLHGSERY
jgi:hypothetical protein